jgi:hypothetical protein
MRAAAVAVVLIVSKAVPELLKSVIGHVSFLDLFALSGRELVSVDHCCHLISPFPQSQRRQALPLNAADQICISRDN